MPSGRPRVLCVDDEARVLASLSRVLRAWFDVATAESAAKGLEVIRDQGPFAVVVSDMRMPGADGAAFLAAVKQVTPDTVRILLTGQADLDASVRAINRGGIFRFLQKPCPPEQLRATLDEAVEQYRLVTAERVLLQETLRGSVQMLTDVLSMADPIAFGRASRLKTYVREMCDILQPPDRWPIEVAAMLSQLGCVTLPSETVRRIASGETLNESEQEMAARLLTIPVDLLGNIPRLEPVREILRYREKGFDGSGPPSGAVRGDAIPIGARLLRVASDYDLLAARGMKAREAIAALKERKSSYDERALDALVQSRDRAEMREIRTVTLKQLVPGMILVDNVETVENILIVPAGHEVTPHLMQRIRNFSRGRELKVPFRVSIPTPAQPEAARTDVAGG
jgi:response regulator RpfG family c-di-GMP phosphodiesterase